jgi:hypothetical protein
VEITDKKSSAVIDFCFFPVRSPLTWHWLEILHCLPLPLDYYHKFKALQSQLQVSALSSFVLYHLLWSTSICDRMSFGKDVDFWHQCLLLELFIHFFFQRINERQNQVVITDRMWARLLSSTNQPSFISPRVVAESKKNQYKPPTQLLHGDRCENNH